MRCDIQIMWLVEKLEKVQAHVNPNLENLEDQRNLNGWKFYMASCMIDCNSWWIVIHGLMNIMLGPSKRGGFNAKPWVVAIN